MFNPNWKHYRPEEIEIRNNPLTKEKFYTLGFTKRIDIIFLEMENNGPGLTFYCDPNNKEHYYKTIINSLYSEKEQKITLIHEFIHIYYNCRGGNPYVSDERGVEKIIEKETSRMSRTSH